jgi:Xaa-Pro aminopeptidase
MHAPTSSRTCAPRCATPARRTTSSRPSTTSRGCSTCAAPTSLQPVFLAHAAARAPGATLFVGAGKIDAALTRALAADGVAVAPYDDVAAALAALPADARLLVDPRRTTLGWSSRAARARIEAINPSTLAKSRRATPRRPTCAARWSRTASRCASSTLVRGRARRPGAAQPITELTIDEKLDRGARERPGYVGPSFATIAAFNANGAMPHYRATPESHATIEGDGLLLIDSGAQYRGGTTDITRMWPIGASPKRSGATSRSSCAERSRSAATRFPRGTPGPMLDAIARAPLWEHGLDYGHGTGHGVGYFLNVHEGPQTISRAVAEPAMAMEPGMITSIEPVSTGPASGACGREPRPQRAGGRVGDAFGEFLEFETLTLCPIDTRIERLLDPRDRLADATSVRERLAPRLDDGWPAAPAHAPI